MDLIIGGAYNGKTTYALKTYNLTLNDLINGEECNKDTLFNKKGIYNLHMLIKNIIDSNNYNENFHTELLEKIIYSNMEVVICNEVGSGIIPIEKSDRQMREYTGKLLSELSSRCEKVIRIYYGIPSIIKES